MPQGMNGESTKSKFHIFNKYSMRKEFLEHLPLFCHELLSVGVCFYNSICEAFMRFVEC